MAAQLDFHPEKFDVDMGEDKFVITRKNNIPPPKPIKEWDPVHQRWCQRLGKVVTPYDRNQTGGNYERKNIPTRIYI